MNMHTNLIALFPNAVMLLKGMQVYLKGTVFSDSERINDESTLTFIKPNMHLNLKLGQIEYLIIKIANDERYNVIHENRVYSVLPNNEQLYNRIDSLFMNAIC